MRRNVKSVRLRNLAAAAGLAVAALGIPAIAPACWEAPAGAEHVDLLADARKSLVGASKSARAEALIRAIVDLSGQKSAGGGPLTWIPAGTRLDHVEFPKVDKTGDPATVAFYLELPPEFFASKEFTPFGLYRIGSEIEHALIDEDVTGFLLYIKDPKTGVWAEPDDLIPPEPPAPHVPEVDWAAVEIAKAAGKDPIPAMKEMPVMNPGWPVGSLAGKTVIINQSHGWFDDVDFGRWRVQRGLAFGTNEDLDSATFINMYVLPMLRNAGAKVMTVRESDLQTNMVIVDNSDTAAGLSNGRYTEVGTWSTSTLTGFVQKTTASWVGRTINPFNQGAGQNRLSPALTTGNATATATWTANIPASGYYNVYASWTPFSGRANDAQYLVYHSGGVSEVKMNQKIDGYTWVLLGNWYFEAGSAEDKRKVVLTNKSNDATAATVSADAVRWGGGMGDFARQTHGISGRPRWEEEAINYLQFTGFGRSGTLYNDVDDESGGWSDRPQYAGWEVETKEGVGTEDAVYFAWHTNAASGTARGLTTYGRATPTAASQSFQNIMHNKMYAAIDTLWFTTETWTVRSKNFNNNYGENNQTSLGQSVAGFLIEGLFHDNETDSTAYNEPKFRQIYARAITQGVIDYFNTRDTTTKPYPPEAPVNFRAESLGGGQVQLSWSAGPTGGFNGAAATSYKVFRSINGFGFDDGTVVSGGATTVTLGGLPPAGTAEYFRVCAVNAGGQSFPTETLAASNGQTNVLLVQGFDRNQRSLIPTASITNLGNPVIRHDPRTFQAFNYVIEHAEAIAPGGFRISSTSNEPVGAGTVNLANYDLVVWISGEESTDDETLSAAEQTRVQAYLAGANKRLFISGAELGWDLGRSGASTAADISFFNNVLRATYVGDDAGTYIIGGIAGTPFASVGSLTFDRAAGARYDAEYPDRISVSGGSVAGLSYTGGSGGTAGIYYNGGTTGPKVVVLGFPFETIATKTQRTTLMNASISFFGISSTAAVKKENWMIF